MNKLIITFIIVFGMSFKISGLIDVNLLAKSNFIHERLLKSIILNVSKRYNVQGHVGIIRAICINESSRKIDVIGGSGEIGLMQVTLALLNNYNRVHKVTYTTNDMLNPYNNIGVGVWYYSLCLKKHRSIDKSLMAYNAGINRKQYGNLIYIKKVKQHLIKL